MKEDLLRNKIMSLVDECFERDVPFPTYMMCARAIGSSASGISTAIRRMEAEGMLVRKRISINTFLITAGGRTTKRHAPKYDPESLFVGRQAAETPAAADERPKESTVPEALLLPPIIFDGMYGLSRRAVVGRRRWMGE